MDECMEISKTAMYGDVRKLIQLVTPTNQNKEDFGYPFLIDVSGYLFCDGVPITIFEEIKEDKRLELKDKSGKLLYRFSLTRDVAFVISLQTGTMLMSKPTIRCGQDYIMVSALLDYAVNSHIVFATETGVYSINIFQETEEEG